MDIYKKPVSCIIIHMNFFRYHWKIDMATQTCDRTITGNNFDYGSALSVIQEEEYLEDEDFDEIRLIRRQGEVIQAIDEFGEKYSDEVGTLHKRETQSLETGLCYGYSNSGYTD